MKPTLVSVVALDGHNERTLLAFAAGAVRGLQLPLATAIFDSARERDIQVAAVDRVRHTSGTGVVASIDGHTVVVGNAALFTDLGVSVDRLGEWPERLQQRGQHVVFVAVDGQAAGFLGVIDAGVPSVHAASSSDQWP